MKKIVLDASIAVKWFFTESDSEIALKIQKKIEKGNFKVYVPQIFFFEVINVLKTKASTTTDYVKKAVKIIFSLPLKSNKVNEKLFKRANFYAQKYNLSIYDASYIALAKILNINLITADKKLFNKVNLDFVKFIGEFK
jgi:predicted nucleic acid-binding protein